MQQQLFKEPEHKSWRIALDCQLTVLVIAGLAALPLAADPIHLQCLLKDNYLVRDYGNNIPEIQRTLCQQLKERLDRKALLLAWDYVVYSGPGPAPMPAFVITLSNNGQRRELTVLLQRKAFPTDPWRRVWKEPGDTLVDPLPSKAAEFFADKIDELILTSREETISKHIMGIPIATANWSLDGPPKVITNLPWKGNEVLRASQFRLYCQSKQHIEEFESHALRPDKGPFSLEAIHRLSDKKKVQDIMPEVKKLKPTLLFLLQFQIPDDTDIYSN